MSSMAEWLSADFARLISVIIVVLLFGVAAGLFVRAWLKRPRDLETPFADMPTQLVTIGDWNFRFHQSGRGPHLVLLHGIGANLFCWRWLVPFLRERFTVTVIDLPGHGRSLGPANSSYGLDDQCERLVGFFDRMGIHNMYLVGNSMGGNIAAWMALNNPDRVLGLGLIAPATSAWLVPLSLGRLHWISKPVSLMLTRQAMRWAHNRTVSKRHLVGAERVEETFRTYGGNAEAVRSFMAATEAIRDPRLGKRLSEIKAPTLILWGSRDKLVTRKVIDELESALGATESQVHMGGGHHLQEDEPEWVAEKLASFFLSKPD